jgi:hypothetical protein
MGGNASSSNPQRQRVANMAAQGASRQSLGTQRQQSSRAEGSAPTQQRDIQQARAEQQVSQAPSSTLAGKEAFARQKQAMDAKFVPDMGEVGSEDVMEAVVGGRPDDAFGQSPFRRAGTDKRKFLEQRREEAPEVVGSDSTVELQENAPMVGGGEPGVGQQGFGQRALIGGEAQIVSPEDPQSMDAPVDGVMTEVAQSDVGIDPNYVEPSPGQEIIDIQAYNLPIDDEQMAFVPGSREALRMARGPISRSLMNLRSGFGRKMMG